MDLGEKEQESSNQKNNDVGRPVERICKNKALLLWFVQYKNKSNNCSDNCKGQFIVKGTFSSTQNNTT